MGHKRKPTEKETFAKIVADTAAGASPFAGKAQREHREVSPADSD
jgi:hypothetical protein